ncbi:GntR family transcriptional regulator [Labedella populi]|uniref:GntR family transcriptional regulator n=1 Tax=Labedella populi TaxID=2498850 RepID=A0A444QDV7_9MICO|nr:GntR family transcriptional regulator [Labedella populi]RWZ67724.1 GntR family transcriptional regulator [Labedella populi]
MLDDPLAEPWSFPLLGRTAAPVREQVVAALRQAILDFQLKPGQRLVERELIESMGVSRTTVREALSVLTSEGLVAVIPQRGAHVAAPSLDDAEDLYDVRASLESLVVRRFVERATDEQVARLGRTVDEMASLLERESPDDADGYSASEIREFLAAKDVFYDVLVEGAQSASLTQLLESIQARVRVLRVTSLATRHRLPAVVTEMREIVAAIAARNPDRAARLLTEHIQTAARLALRTLRDNA